MVKLEDYAEDAGPDADARDSRGAAVDLLPGSVHASLKEEEGQPSSSSSSLRLQFIGMGFSPKLVDKVLQRHGDDDSNTILESLLSYSDLPLSGSESSGSLGSLFDSDNEENNSPLESRKGIDQDIKPKPDSFSEKWSYLLRTMYFSQQEVDLAFKKLGDEAPLEQLVDCIVSAQSGGSSGELENGDATNEGKAEALFGVMEKTLSLLQKGFTEEEVSSAIDNFGQRATVEMLADSILARRIANSVEQKEVKVESDLLGEAETDYSTYQPSYSAASCYDDDNNSTRVKRAKNIFMDDRGASSSHPVNPWYMGRSARISDMPVKEELEAMTPGRRANVRGNLAKPPYFLYGNVVEVPKDTWHQLTQFLYNVEPEFVNSQFFSALSRKEGYIHNLPVERRRFVVPKSPMTIEEALPFTRQWWPSWDTRKHISVVTIEPAGIEQTCDRLGRMVRESRGVLSEEKQMQIMHQCRVSNLIWVGRDKLSPLEPRQVERILGYPHNHTNLFELSQADRFAVMRYAFQTDTLAYFLSVMKDQFPDGIRVLSIYSGIGGAEVTFHRLGIPLKCVVSVEESDVNRKILRRWWLKTEQTGELRQLHGIGKLKTQVIGDLINEFGGFDLIIGGNYTSCKGGTTVNTTMGMDSSRFFEYARVVKRVRTEVGLN
ncbi:probable inactive DNA (cytosine-5)-methyltransferase DRM3 [Panicum virgatum]|uniref:probable inactive DNA (cytosine-5)-methyltransferase DRM3 n=1 Tax=Panicum virgatum TaxID=38727 RepID=UPI0019D66C5A|nr:probable inactive DNA (cytosine-5)-methyltransferase DRM3 [Panicum virgatum]XP_039799157.1 probable inactive DNA (cytosine-5)-methyltransferase DRM3 [Panicum virgatum]XP_039799158.1 probable inactive DNA (cytosine-5)-methyltransferase DRM3 [Panicum virgatum]